MLILLGAVTGTCRKIAPAVEQARDVPLAAESTAASRQLEELGREAGLKFPPGARLVGVQRERGIDDLVAAKVEMKPAALSEFLARSPVRLEDFRPGERGLLGDDHDWWDPNKAARLRSGQANLPNARALNIGIDDSRADVVVVYVVNHGT